jgi:serine/threonine protein kinase/tetratricopeptide (TPR) repeat protein
MTRQYRVGDEPVAGYRLAQLLGQGRFGAVWRAIIPRGTEIALKIIPFDSADVKKIRGLQLVSKIKHPHIIPIRGLWLKDDTGQVVDPALIDSGRTIRPLIEAVQAMDLAQKNLAERLRECTAQRWPGIPPEELLEHMEGAARGIDYLGQSIFDLGAGPTALPHCNIKPANILLLGGTVRLADVGLAHALGDTAGSLGNSAFYQAPELFLQGRPGPRTDQYSLAVTYTELRTGSLPVQAESLHKIIAAHLQGALDLSRLPEAEQAVIRKATAVDPQQRYPSTVEMVRALRQTLQRAAVSPPPRGSLAPRSQDGHLMLQPGVEIVPGYKLVRLLGRGGYGEVWESSAPGHLRIALKIVRNLDANTGRQEFKALQLIKNINHAYLLALHAYWLLDAHGNVIPDDEEDKPDAPAPSVLVLATRLADKNLMQRLKECQKEGQPGIPPDELIDYMRQAASAIDYLNAERHALGDRLGSIQHRDIKPENILLTPGAALVADFGLARLLQGSQSRVSADSMGLTPLYAAPELLSGSVSRWSDQYSLALTYFHMRTGTTPFARDPSPYAVIQAHLDGKLDLSGLQEPERSIIARGTARESAKRWPSCAEMVKALQQALVPAPEAIGPTPPGSPVLLPAAKHETDVRDRQSTLDPHLFETVLVAPESPGPAASKAPTPATSSPPPSGSGAGQPTPLMETVLPGSGQRGPGQPGAGGWATPARPRRSLRWAKWLAFVLVFALTLGVGGWLTWPQWRDALGLGPPVYTPEQVQQEIRERHYVRALEMIEVIENTGLWRQTRTDLRTDVRNAWLKEIEVELERGQDIEVDDMTVRLLEHFKDDPEALRLRATALDRLVRPPVAQAIAAGQYPEALALLDKPHYDSPVRTELRAGVRTGWLKHARALLDAGKPDDALVVFGQLLSAFPNDGEAVAWQHSARRDSIRARVERLTKAAAFTDAGKLLSGEWGTLGKGRAEDLKRELLNAWRAEAMKQPDKDRKIKMLRDLLAFAEDTEARAELYKIDPSSKPRDPKIEQWLAARVTQAEQLLADKAKVSQALTIVDEVLTNSDAKNLPALRQRAGIAKARAQAGAGDWKGLPDTLTSLPADLPPTEQAVVLVLRLLADDARSLPAGEMLNSLAEVRAKEKLLAGLSSWEREQYIGVRQRVLDKVIRQAADMAGPRIAKPRYDEALALLDQALACDPEHVRSLLAKGDLLYRKADYAAARGVLEKTAPLAKDPVDRLEVDALLALIGLRPDATMPERTDSLKRLPGLLGVAGAPRQGPICISLAETARKSPNLRSTAAPLLRKAHPMLADAGDKKRVGELLAQLYRDAVADAQGRLKEKNFTAVHEALRDADALAADATAQADVEALRALAWLQEPGQRPKAFDAIGRLAAQPNPPRALELGNGLILLGETDETTIKDVQLAVAKLIDRIPTKTDRENLQASLRRLGDVSVVKHLREVNTPPNWAQLLNEFRQGEETDWKKVAQAECLVMQHKTVAQPDLKRARELLDAKPPPDVGPYTHYVRGLVFRAENNVPQAAIAMLEAYRLDPPPYLGGFRRKRAVQIMREAVSALRADADDLTDPARNPFRLTFAAGAAEKVAPLAEKIIQMARADGETVPLELQILHALALSQQSKPDPVAARKAIDALLALPAEKLGGARLSLLLAKTRLETDATDLARRATLALYDELAGQLLSRASYDEQLARAFYDQVLERGLRLADKWPLAATDGEIKKQLARLHGALGEIVTNFPNSKWPFRDEPIGHAIDAYTQAINLDDETRPEYHIGRGLARSLLPEPDLTGMARDAEAAIALPGGEKLPGAHNLQGYALLLQSRQVTDPAQRIAKLRLAVAACRKAVDLRRQRENDPADLATLLKNLHGAALDLGNYLSDKAEKRKYFDQAKTAAEEATKLPTERDPDEPWRALGLVLEDIAWQLNEARSYDEALKAFEKAIEKRPTHSKAYIDRARCLWRAVTTAGRNPAELAHAEKDLQAALKHKPPPDDRVQALAMLGRVYLAQEDYARAAGLSFEEAIKEARTAKAPSWPLHVLEWVRAAVPKGEELHRAKNKAGAELLEAARKPAERVLEALKISSRPLEETWRLEAASLLGSIHETRGYPSRALLAYLDALPDIAVLEHLARDNKLADGTGLRFRFLIKRGAMLLQHSKNEEVVKATSNFGGPIEASRRDLAVAVQLAEVELALTAQEKMTAYGLSGLAHDRAATGSNVAPYRATAAKHLEKAHRFPGAPQTGDYWFWRYRLGDIYSKQMDSAPASSKAQLWQDGLANLEAARKAAPKDYQDGIQKAIDEHRKKKPF